MKKLLTLILSFITLWATAQSNILNGGFEDTTVVYIDQNTMDTLIDNWAQESFGSGVTSDAYTGQIAAYIWNWYYYAAGRLTNGSSNWPNLKGGTPISYRPSTLKGFYKYIAGETSSTTDTATAEIWLFKYNSTTNKRDTIGYGIGYLTLISNYTGFTVDVEYLSQDMPDTVLVSFASSLGGFCDLSSNGNCLFLYLDDISLTEQSTGINHPLSLGQKTQVYPNPASEFVYIKASSNRIMPFEIYNTLGELVYSANTQANGITSIDVNSLPTGMYLIKGADFEGRFIKR